MTDLIYVKETPWQHLAKTLPPEELPDNPSEILKKCDLDWTTYAAPMKTELHGQVRGYHAIYREADNNRILGVVNTPVPKIVQNVDTFNMLEDLLKDNITFESAGSVYGGGKVFGCFRITQEHKIIDDEVTSYFLVVNDHLKPDGKVTIMNTPVRVVCQNMLTYATSKNNYMYRIPCVKDVGMNKDLAYKIFENAENTLLLSNRKAEKLLKVKVDRPNVEKILDELFPMQTDREGFPLESKANERVSIMRDTFVSDCLGADNLANYRGTAYQVYNALTDYTQHYFSNVNKAYDLDARMSLIPGMATETEPNKVKKFMEIINKMAA